MLELVIVMAVIAIVAGISISSLSTFSRNQGLGNGTEMIITAVNDARLKTMSSEGGFQYGVHFEASKAVLFTGTTYSATAVSNVVYNMPTAVEISTISLAGSGVDVVFKKITGKTDQYGSIIIRLRADNSRTKTININSNGAISI